MNFDETHDPALRSFVASANAPDGDFPIQNLPYVVFRRGGDDAPPRVGVAIGAEILDIAAVAGLMDGVATGAAAACASPHLNALMERGPAGLGRAAHRAVAVVAQRRGATRGSREAPDADRRCRAVAAGADRQLHRFLRLDLSRHQCRPAVPARQSADAELQIRAGRLSQPRLLGARQRHAGAPAPRPDQAPRRGGAGLSHEPQSRLRARARLLHRHAVRRSANRCRSLRPAITCSASASSTTGRRATSRPGNPSRSVRSWPRISPPRCRPSSSPRRRSRPIAPAPMRGRRATPRRCPHLTAAQTRNPAASISSWRPICSPRRCATAARRRSGSASAPSPTSTGRWRRWSRTTPAMAAISRSATSWVRAPCRGRRERAGRACWNSPSAARNRSRSPMARPAATSKTATRSSSAATAPKPGFARLGFGECRAVIAPAAAV